MTTATAFDSYPIAVLGRIWWAVLLKALGAIVFAAYAFFWVGRSLPSLITAFAAYAVADGLLSLIGAIQGGGLVARARLALAGLVSLGAATTAALLPDLTSPNMATIIGGWAMIRGGLEFASALKLEKLLETDVPLALIGGFSMLFGVMMTFHPATYTSKLVPMVAGYSLILGFMLVVLALRFRRPSGS